MYENELANLIVNILNPPWPHAHVYESQQRTPASALRHRRAPLFTSAMLYFTVLLNFPCCHGYRHSGLNISRQFAFVKGSVYSGFQLRLCATPSTASAAQLFRQTHTHTDIVHLVLKDTSQIPIQVRCFWCHVPSNTFRIVIWMHLAPLCDVIYIQKKSLMLNKSAFSWSKYSVKYNYFLCFCLLYLKCKP